MSASRNILDPSMWRAFLDIFTLSLRWAMPFFMWFSTMYKLSIFVRLAGGSFSWAFFCARMVLLVALIRMLLLEAIFGGVLL